MYQNAQVDLRILNLGARQDEWRLLGVERFYGARPDVLAGGYVWFRTMNLRVVQGRTKAAVDVSASAPRTLAWCTSRQIRWRKCPLSHHESAGGAEADRPDEINVRLCTA